MTRDASDWQKEYGRAEQAPIEGPPFERAPAEREGAERPLTVMVFAPTAEARDAYRRLLVRETVLSVPTWPLAVTLGSQVDCAVVAVPPSAVFDAAGAIHALREEHPALPVVYAADDVLRARDQVERARIAHEVIRYGGAGATVSAAIQAACTAALLERTAAQLHEAGGVPSALQAALVRLCASEPPPRAVAELAGGVPVHRRTLWYQWRQHVGAAPLRLEDVVAWVLLLRASILRLRGSSWTEAATALGVHRHTVARAAERLADTRLPRGTGDLTRHHAAALRQRFVSKVLTPILRY